MQSQKTKPQMKTGGFGFCEIWKKDEKYGCKAREFCGILYIVYGRYPEKKRLTLKQSEGE